MKKKDFIHHLIVKREPLSTSFVVSKIIETKEDETPVISTPIKLVNGEDYFLLYAEFDERKKERHRYIDIFKTKQEAQDGREEMLQGWCLPGKTKLLKFGTKKPKYEKIKLVDMEIPVRFLVAKVKYIQ